MNKQDIENKTEQGNNSNLLEVDLSFEDILYVNLEHKLSDFFDLSEIQGIQDSFSSAIGVASLITEVDGTPITNSSNICYLCNQIVRKTEKGRKNCILSNSIIGIPKKDGARIQRCLGAGLICAAASIIIDGKHVANWLIGQVIDEDDELEDLLAYADVIGVNRDVYKNESVKVKRMSNLQFENICKFLYLNAQQLSKYAMKNVLLTKEIEKKIIKEKEIINLYWDTGLMTLLQDSEAMNLLLYCLKRMLLNQRKSLIVSRICY